MAKGVAMKLAWWRPYELDRRRVFADRKTRLQAWVFIGLLGLQALGAVIGAILGGDQGLFTPATADIANIAFFGFYTMLLAWLPSYALTELIGLVVLRLPLAIAGIPGLYSRPTSVSYWLSLAVFVPSYVFGLFLYGMFFVADLWSITGNVLVMD